jgi:hypothetical protein
MKLFELKSPAELIELESQLDQLMYSVGLDVEFSNHFKERLLGRDRMITIPEIVDAFKKLKKKYKRKLLQYKKTPSGRKFLKDFDNDLNVIFEIEPGEKLPQLINITIMKKPPGTFRSTTPSGTSEELPVGIQKRKEDEIY